MADGTGYYLKRLIKVKCDKGTMANYLNVETDHGVIWYTLDENGAVQCELPFMNANDHVGDVNLFCFGDCTSEENKVFGGKRDFHIGSLMDALGTAWGFKQGYKCTPYCSKPWVSTQNDVLLDGAPSITSCSTVPCYYGGTIEIYVEEETTEGTTEGSTAQS